ncbi:1,4-dihydroxy-2-naphthoate polyprenyltransferase [Avibacterium paragallinarum]|uniref:1,4-dihydroxy-2-naphthoate octaprenyltransferase n=1 Tax=Avibacterium paragallinarum TaxID=728 RepID=A0A377I4W8_AVIPA|nr:1,4-dihydroxy-2-naphthoate polyprenyltransferase [Avibacterium paragallinarum]POY46477.1 1,4-dihydroxy-2-naphthoate octaprenyltransferase [Avibacterium paragallinarum]QZP15924.1 1,4-dihydroxy-2-naphthoate polyprenyltransferase [Avibacterium paragallinarum]RZN75002.1 1,4-dihydroxy-2-naphthoate polyprenyltransferase [Avibacterium paragallinarum]WAL55830.1 1,4-dihydroxy-2-naphthoate polyprenyltransferase [Avibacterium paragallinarum]WAM58426.1 1,4-dihydroxy-2-naphthoate polyprenyltransferase [
MNKNSVKMWVETARPKTLPLAAASIIMGAALAYWDKQFSWQISLLCLITTLLLQILSNFANDYGDHQKGSDTAERIGPLRGIQHGVISAAQLKKGLILMSLASLFFGFWLIALAYQTYADLFAFSLLGGLAILAAITYTVGAKPYGYMGLGDISVLLFFGILGVCGTYYLQTHQLNLMIFLPALSTGLLSTAVLNINNLRDIEQDRKAGKNTLAVRFGAKNGRIYHCLLLAVAALCNVIFALLNFHHLVSFIFLLAYPLLVKHALYVYRNRDPLLLRPMLGQMSMLALLTNLLFSFGLLVG